MEPPVVQSGWSPRILLPRATTSGWVFGMPESIEIITIDPHDFGFVAAERMHEMQKKDA